MNHCVPIFHEMEEEDSVPTPSDFSRPKKPATGEEDIMELLWQNGQIVVRPPKKNSFGGGEALVQAEREIRSSAAEEQQHLFMQEDEMSSWLQYPLDESSFDRDLYSDLLYSAPPPPSLITAIPQTRAIAEIRPPPPPVAPAVTKLDNSSRLPNFVHFSRLPIRQRSDKTSALGSARDSTVVDSNDTPKVRPESRIPHMVSDSKLQVNAESGTATTVGELAAGTCEPAANSSPGGSRTSFSASGEPPQPLQKPPEAAVDRKRKTGELDDNEFQSEDEFEAAHEAKKHARGSTSTKRSRAAEVHNQSERRRRDRINEKMKALQELIPRCNKSDKASMLDEAIEYLKSLQLQVQMMSMGCGMVPMMYPGMQQFMPTLGMGMGMNRSMVPYPPMLPGSGIPNPAAAHMAGPRFPMPQFHMQHVPVPNPSRIPAPNQTVPPPNLVIPHSQNNPQMPNFVDPYQQFLSLHHSQLPLPQNQAPLKPGSTKPITKLEIGNPDNNNNHQNG